jgi:hypothetical protein
MDGYCHLLLYFLSQLVRSVKLSGNLLPSIPFCHTFVGWIKLVNNLNTLIIIRLFCC